MMAVSVVPQSVNFADVPLHTLRHSARGTLSEALNPTKVIPSPSNLPRDWRGLAQLAGVTCPHAGTPDPTALVLSSWEKKEGVNIQTLIDYLKEIDRWDVIDDTLSLIESDVSFYLESLKTKVSIPTQQEQGIDDSILTIDDLRCIENNGSPQLYDAFLLFDDSDREFALTMLTKLENEYGLKLCCKDRDLVGGITFEHEAIMRLIRERCGRLIVIISPLFLESPANKFFLSFAQALGIEHRQRKIIPCVYSKFIYPTQLKYYFVLDYTRSSGLWNFWDRLCQSIKAVAPSQKALPSSSRYQTNAIASPEQSAAKAIENCDIEKLRLDLDPPCKSPSPSNSNLGIGQPVITEPTSSSSVQMSSSTVLNSTVNSVDSESLPSLNSRSSSTASLLSRVFTPKRITPKWFKKKKKVSVAV